MILTIHLDGITSMLEQGFFSLRSHSHLITPFQFLFLRTSIMPFFINFFRHSFSKGCSPSMITKVMQITSYVLWYQELLSPKPSTPQVLFPPFLWVVTATFPVLVLNNKTWHRWVAVQDEWQQHAVCDLHFIPACNLCQVLNFSPQSCELRWNYYHPKEASSHC